MSHVIHTKRRRLQLKNYPDNFDGPGELQTREETSSLTLHESYETQYCSPTPGISPELMVFCCFPNYSLQSHYCHRRKPDVEQHENTTWSALHPTCNPKPNMKRQHFVSSSAWDPNLTRHGTHLSLAAQNRESRIARFPELRARNRQKFRSEKPKNELNCSRIAENRFRIAIRIAA